MYKELFIFIEIFDNITNYAYSGVQRSALSARSSDRVDQLSQPKKVPNGYVDAYTLPKLVPEQALRVQATHRTCALAKPRKNIFLLHTAWKKQQK